MGGGKIAISIFFLIVGLLYCRFAKYPLPWSLDAAFIATFFIVVGQLFMQHRYKAEKLVQRYRLILVMVFLFSLIFNFNNIEMFENRYGNELLFLAGSITASLLILWICRRIKIKNGLVLLIAEYGKLSLLVYIIHNYFLIIPGALHNRIILQTETDTGWEYVYWILSSVFVLTLVLPLCLLINKRAKWLIGK